MESYFCKSCDIKFDANGNKVEWFDATFGPCRKMVAKCPSCGEESDEYRLPKQSNGSFHNHTPACGSCCGGCGL
ncbi:hypothetical protein CYCD_04430 [Tenuifilaceae bacterium CYCD]|nr:hypothetical protein CYCD_04430 [Tenuifilaceae bacterium CYCD]